MNFIRYPQDVFKLDYKKIEKLDGWGGQSVNNLKFSINEKKNISLERFIFALGIRHIGLETAKLISRHVKTPQNFLKLDKIKNLKEIENIDGIGETQIESIKKFFDLKTNKQIINELNSLLNIEIFQKPKNDGLLKNKTFMFTGKLTNVSRSEAKNLIEQNSGSIVTSVSKKLDFLIIGEKPTKEKLILQKNLK